jgi:hypothetical protein
MGFVNERLEPIAGLLDISTNLYTKALAGVGREAFVTRPSGSTNSLVWIAGHVLQSRVRLRRLVGEQIEMPWPEIFGPGGPLADTSRYPAAAELVGRWRDESDALARRLDVLDPADLAAPPGMRVPSHDGTLLGAVAFAAYHEAYHAGQMGYLRKWHGLSPLVER